jgi:hypothetical protein
MEVLEAVEVFGLMKLRLQRIPLPLQNIFVSVDQQNLKK